MQNLSGTHTWVTAYVTTHKAILLPHYWDICSGRAETSSVLCTATWYNEFRFSTNNCWREQRIKTEKQCSRDTPTSASPQNAMKATDAAPDDTLCPSSHSASSSRLFTEPFQKHPSALGSTRTPDAGSLLQRKATTPMRSGAT